MECVDKFLKFTSC